MGERLSCPCPHPACDATIPVDPSRRAGEYRCPCQACAVRLSWATRLPTYQLVPCLTLIQEEEHHA